MPKKKRKPKSKTRKKQSKLLKFILSPVVLKTSAVILVGIFLITFNRIYINPPKDARALRIDAYFRTHGAPLAGYGHTFVKVADICDMDWRLLPAIAMQESTGGKFMRLNNPFGWGSAEIPYSSLEEAIFDVGLNLCGKDPDTAKWYATTSTYEKLYWYNGTVRPAYPDEVLWIMEQI